MFWFNKYKPVYNQIDEYVAQKAKRYPLKAGIHRSLLRRLIDNSNITDARQLTLDHIAYFVGEELSEYYKQDALKAIRCFVRYGRLAGYTNISPYDLMESTLGRPRNTRRIKEVQELRAQGLSIRQIRKELIARHKKPVHVTQVYRWTKYKET